MQEAELLERMAQLDARFQDIQMEMQVNLMAIEAYRAELRAIRETLTTEQQERVRAAFHRAVLDITIGGGGNAR